MHLGWTEAERQQTQPVDLAVHLRFPQAPKACDSEQLDETICYDSLVSFIKTLCAEQSFQLIERLGAWLYNNIKHFLGSDVDVWLQVTKVYPPISDLSRGVSFTYGDWQAT